MTLDKISKYFALLTVYAFVIGYQLNSSYYSSFNINILSYVNNIELLYSLLPTTSIVLFLLFSFLFNYDDFRNRDLADISSFEKMMSTSSLGSFFILLIVVLITILPQRWLGDGYKGQQFLCVGVYFFYYYWVSKKYIREYFRNGKIHPKMTIILVIISFVFTSIYSFYDASVIKRWGNKRSYFIKTKEELITTDKIQFVIGETQSTIFLYNKKTSSTRILNREHIDSLVIQ